MSAHAALQWYLDHGVDDVLGDAPVNRYELQAKPEAQDSQQQSISQPLPPMPPQNTPVPAATTQSSLPILGAAEAKIEAIKQANAAESLAELEASIMAFEGLEVKKTASNLVFADGNPKAPIMLIGEAPGADEDRQGLPFVGQSGQLLDRIFSHIGIDRKQDDAAQSVYISNILNWRPPGNRTPTTAEIVVSLPFIEKHIALVQPKLIILCGAVAAKALLARSEGISRLRKSNHTYQTQTPELNIKVDNIPAIATYHPAYLLRTPIQKKAVWSDMLKLQKMRQEIGLIDNLPLKDNPS